MSMRSAIQRRIENRNIINKVNELKKSRGDYKRYIPLIERLFSDVKFKGIDIANKEVYRYRKCNRDDLFYSISDLLYPKPEFVCRKGRLNDIHESILYCSTSELGALVEFDNVINDCFVISKFKRKTNHELICIPVGISNIGFENLKLSKMDEEIMAFCEEELTRSINNESDYDITRAIGDFFFNKTIEGELKYNNMCMAYSSVKGRDVSNTTTYNIAMLPSVFDDNFEFEYVSLYTLSLNQDTIHLHELNRGELEVNGEIRWMFDIESMLTRVSSGLVTSNEIFDYIIGAENYFDKFVR
jgi:hypothetical protein